MEKAEVEKYDIPVQGSDTSLTEPNWTEEEENRIRRKLDWHLVPLVTSLYLLCFLDRANIGNARIQGMAKDLNLVGYRFNWALTIFYFTYTAVEIPSNIILRKVGPKYYLPFLVLGFGLVSLCTAFVRNFRELCVARAFLGLVEGGTMPGISFFLSCFYKRKELLFRVGIFVSASSIAGAFGGLLATGLTRIPKWGLAATPIHTWRNIFFFEGLITMLVACIAPFFMPQRPDDCRFLTERERYIAMERLVQEQKASLTEVVQPRHVKRAMLNFHNVMMASGFFLINITVQSFSLFLPTILKDLGWEATKAQLYSVPPYVVACCVSIAIAFISDRTKKRGVYLAGFTLITIMGFAILRTASNANIKYMAVYFAALGAFPGGPGFLSWGLNNAAGPAVRAVTSAYIVSLGSLGAIVATWTYLDRDKPKYRIGHTINLVAEVGVFCVAVTAICFCYRENKIRKRGGRDYRLQGLTQEQQDQLGHLHPEFRYIP